MSDKIEFAVDTKDLIQNSIQLLFDYLINSSKHDAKNRFNKLIECDRHVISEMDLEFGVPIQIMLSLDHSEFNGELNFANFQKYLAQLVGLLAMTLENGEELLLREEKNTNRFLVELAAPVDGDEQRNILMLGFNLQSAAVVILELMFFEPSQFRPKP
ncbi:MAG: hypothetical protein MK003_09590 [Pseudomonadales bacterium]|nr:hypothetical protein [Pseudomonadales bacterium]